MLKRKLDESDDSAQESRAGEAAGPPDAHDSICQLFRLLFSTDGYERVHHPSFVHQLFSVSQMHDLESREGARFQIKVDTYTLNMHVSGDHGDGGGASAVELRDLLHPLLSRLPVDSFYFDERQFMAAVEKERGEVKELMAGKADPLPASHELGKGEEDEDDVEDAGEEGDGEGRDGSEYGEAPPVRLLQGTLEDPWVARLSSRLQPLLLLFIDAASIIDQRDLKWRLNWLFSPTLGILGFCSAYPFFMFPAGIRLRISQFFVMPPCQRRGWGSLLYRELVQRAAREEAVQEITVEDPNDSFSTLRLSCDRHLLATGNKLNAQQRAKASLLLRYGQMAEASPQSGSLSSEDFAQFRRELRRHLARQHSALLPSEREHKMELLDRLCREEMALFSSILKIAPISGE